MKSVEVYSVDGCPSCVKVKDYLNRNNISFVEKDVQKSTEHCEELRDLTHQVGVPVTIIEGKILMGFPEFKFNELLEI